jgi:hypothetical protein
MFLEEANRGGIHIVQHEKPVDGTGVLQPALRSLQPGTLIYQIGSIGVNNEGEQVGEALVQFLDRSGGYPEDMRILLLIVTLFRELQCQLCLPDTVHPIYDASCRYISMYGVQCFCNVVQLLLSASKVNRQEVDGRFNEGKGLGCLARRTAAFDPDVVLISGNVVGCIAEGDLLGGHWE